MIKSWSKYLYQCLQVNSVAFNSQYTQFQIDVKLTNVPISQNKDLFSLKHMVHGIAN